MKRRSISLIIPLYNKSGTVARAIDSAVNQSVAFDEIIVVDDCSTDDSLAAARCALLSFSGKAVVLEHRTNRGPGAARNTGLAQSTGDIVCFLDADDFLAPGLVAALADASSSLETMSMIIYQVEDAESGVIRPRASRLARTHAPLLLRVPDFVEAMTSDPLFCSGGNVALSGREARAVTFDEQARSFEDWDYYFQVQRILAHRGLPVYLLAQVGLRYCDDDPESLSRAAHLKPAYLRPPGAAMNTSHDRRLRRLVVGLWLCHGMQRASFAQKVALLLAAGRIARHTRPFLRHGVGAAAALLLGRRGYDLLSRWRKRRLYA